MGPGRHKRGRRWRGQRASSLPLPPPAERHWFIRPPEYEDAAGILRIVREHGLPPEWVWPNGKHGIVVDHLGEILAFCILTESIYGLVIEELWEQKSRPGIIALGMLGRVIERIAQNLANERGAPLACGGLVRDDRPDHIAALKKRGYGQIGVILEKIFTPTG